MEDLSREVERAITYKFLSECFYLPDNEQVKVMLGYKEFVGSRYSEISEYLESIEDIKSIMVDFTKLFVGPFGLLAAPYGSIYLEDGGVLMGNSTVNVERLFSEEGIKVNINEAPDHIAVELEFMSFLGNMLVEAMKVLDASKIELYHQKQGDFLDIHLGCWIEAFTKIVEENAQTEFYKILARLTRDFVLNDKANVLKESYAH